MKKIISVLLILAIPAVTFTSCSDHRHNWTRISCTEPKVCSVCGKHSFFPAGHIDSGYGFCKECNAVLDFEMLDYVFALACDGTAAELGDTIREEDYNAIKAFDELCGTSAASHFSEYAYGCICLGGINEEDILPWIEFMNDIGNYCSPN